MYGHRTAKANAGLSLAFRQGRDLDVLHTVHGALLPS